MKVSSFYVGYSKLDCKYMGLECLSKVWKKTHMLWSQRFGFAFLLHPLIKSVALCREKSEFSHRKQIHDAVQPLVMLNPYLLARVGVFYTVTCSGSLHKASELDSSDLVCERRGRTSILKVTECHYDFNQGIDRIKYIFKKLYVSSHMQFEL